MADAENAPVEAPEAAKSEAQSTNTNQEPAQETAPAGQDMHGFTSEQLADMQKFFAANGGYDKVKSRISNPEKPAEQKPNEPATVADAAKQPEPQTQEQKPATPPKGAITADEMMAKYYFEQLSRQEKYAAIKDKIADGSLLSEMKDLGIEIRNPDGSFNDAKINTYLGIKAQTVPAKQNTTSPAEGSAAPTVDYADVGEKITTAEQAYKVITQPGHPKTADAEAFLKEMLNKGR